jgi:hypothetical protein
MPRAAIGCKGAEKLGAIMSPSARKIIELNIRHFHNLLQMEKDPAKRETIKQLLAEQEQMLAALLKNEDG